MLNAINREQQKAWKHTILPAWAAAWGWCTAQWRWTHRQDRQRWCPAPLSVGSWLLLCSHANIRHTWNLSFPPPYCALGILQAHGIFAPLSIPDVIDLGEMWKVKFILIPGVASSVAFLSITILAISPGVTWSSWRGRESPRSCSKVNLETWQGD